MEFSCFAAYPLPPRTQTIERLDVDRYKLCIIIISSKHKTAALNGTWKFVTRFRDMNIFYVGRKDTVRLFSTEPSLVKVDKKTKVSFYVFTQIC